MDLNQKLEKHASVLKYKINGLPIMGFLVWFNLKSLDFLRYFWTFSSLLVPYLTVLNL